MRIAPDIYPRNWARRHLALPELAPVPRRVVLVRAESDAARRPVGHPDVAPHLELEVEEPLVAVDLRDVAAEVGRREALEAEAGGLVGEEGRCRGGGGSGGGCTPAGGC